MNPWNTLLLTALAAFAAFAVNPAKAQLTYNGCGALQPADFQMSELFNKKGDAGAVADPDLSEPTRMDVLVVNRNGVYDHSDIYFVERLGKVKYYDGAAKKVSLMGKIDTWAKAGEARGNDNGLMGMALHPDFTNNRWMYLWYSPNQLIGENRQLRLTRITVKADNTLDMASEKILINVLGSKTDWWHCGGPMTFDDYGDLWVAVGNNSADLDPTSLNVMSKTDSTRSSEWGASSTASLRGGFFRIHPDSSAKGYSIPRGNFGEYWADQFDKLGRPELAAQYRDPKKVLPEVYVKGERSNFSVAVHPTKRWLAWGTVNHASVNDEFNITNHPIFSGYPYFQANNLRTGNHSIDPLRPMNTSPLNSGVQELPPAVPGTINNLVNMSISGPIYRFDPSLKSDVKFPPHFDNKWLVAGFGGGMWAITVDTNTLKTVDTLQVNDDLFGSFRIRNHVMSKFGTDGAWYILNYSGGYNNASNPGAMRVIYKGACKVPVSLAAAPAARPYLNIQLSQTGMKVGESGRHFFGIYDLGGHRVFRAEGFQGDEYSFAKLARENRMRPGAYIVRVLTVQGSLERRISVF
jgi:cytochrome c